MDTGILGGVSTTPEELAEMQKGQYILHACGGKLTRVPVKKIGLPRDPQGHVQRLCLVNAPDGTIYAAQHWCHEVNVASLPTGRLLAVIRYQRAYLPGELRATDAERVLPDGEQRDLFIGWCDGNWRAGIDQADLRLLRGAVTARDIQRIMAPLCSAGTGPCSRLR